MASQASHGGHGDQTNGIFQWQFHDRPAVKQDEKNTPCTAICEGKLGLKILNRPILVFEINSHQGMSENRVKLMRLVSHSNRFCKVPHAWDNDAFHWNKRWIVQVIRSSEVKIPNGCPMIHVVIAIISHPINHNNPSATKLAIA
jgi:hypothetical protein